MNQAKSRKTYYSKLKFKNNIKKKLKKKNKRNAMNAIIGKVHQYNKSKLSWKLITDKKFIAEETKIRKEFN